jgi:RNase P subunit RPR2
MKILYLDIETAPTLVWTWSFWPKYLDPAWEVEAGKTLCYSALWEGDRTVIYDDIRKGEERMLKRIHALLDEADAVVHYNGTKFDIPTLNREFVRYGMAPPSHYHQIDLMSTVKGQFKFTSNKLDYICKRLGLGAKTQHKGMSLWFGCMEGNPADWGVMERYNKQDTKLLRKLYKHLLPWIHNHPNVALWKRDASRPTCHNCGSTEVTAKGAQYNTKAASYKRYKCNSCGTNLRSRLRSEKTQAGVLARTPK